VVLCDQAGVGPMVTTESFDRLRPLNFGIRALREPMEPDVLAREIRRYDPADAAEVSRRLRAVAGIDGAVDQLVALYEGVITEHRERGPAPAAEEGRAAASYLRWLDDRFQERVGLAAESQALRRELAAQGTARMELTAESETLRRELAALQGTATWRLRERLVRWSPLVRLYRLCRGLRRRP